MMYSWKCNNFNQIYKTVFDTVMREGELASPHARETKELCASMIEITNPRQRMCSARSGFNLPFSCAEVLWILSGKGDKDMICHYLPRFAEFHDEGWRMFHAPYGVRLMRYGYDERNEYHFPVVNQFEECYKKLKQDPESRQAVMMLWNPWKDNKQVSKDYPCNNWSHMMIRHGALDWTQVVRSNDLILGVPQNIFQFTHLQEIMAGWLGVEVGVYRHYSDSLHVYTKDFYKLDEVDPVGKDIYDECNAYDARTIRSLYADFLEGAVWAEEHWRGGDLSPSVVCPNSYWDSFMSVIKAYNCVKHGDEMLAVESIDKYCHNEYRVPMLNYLSKKTVNPKVLKQIGVAKMVEGQGDERNGR